ncbi:tRNA:m(4)X modification enzyme TRM13 [Blattella germanica]|nr:tRNA:m(4)X modification enzyme TRM13 [Blattella germanica]
MAESGQCQCFIKRKNRFCRMKVKEGQKYCGEHMLLDYEGEIKDEEKELKRIPCPNDVKHSVYVDKLEKHLNVCNARKKSKPPYLVLGMNRGGPDNREEQNEICVRKAMLDHEMISKEVKNPEYGAKKIKHLIQNASLLRNAEMSEFCENETAFVEFGAGRGQMSYYLAQRMRNSKNCLLLLVDRASQKHKLDNKLKDYESPTVLRIRADIADLNLKLIDQLQMVKRVVSVSKHLCGSATDYALRCLVQHEVSFTGILIAFCCHHRCDWGSYTGKSFFTQNEFSPEDFDVLCCLASWATCGFAKGGESRADVHPGPARVCPLDLSDEERKMIGRKVKSLINIGRQRYLEENGFTCEMIEYVEENVSPENISILATRASRH